MALFAEGKLFREAGTGSGGGDKHNKGYFVDESALTTAYPTAEAGDYAIVESTDTVWVWDSDNQEWVDSDQKGQVTSVNNQTGDVTLTANSVGALPSSGGTVTGEVDIIRENPNNNAQTVLILGAKNTSTGTTKTVKFTMAAGGTASQLQTDANIAPIKHTQSLGSGSIPWRDVYVERLRKDGTIFYLPDGVGFGVMSVFNMPTPNANIEGSMLLYVGQTDSTYTHGYIYECKAQGTEYTGDVAISANTGDLMVECDGDDFINFLMTEGSVADPTVVISGGMVYTAGTTTWTLTAYDNNNNTVCTISATQSDYESAGFTFMGTPADGDICAFVSTITGTTTYAWTQTDVQPAPEALPDQTGQSGKFLTTDGTDASWSDKPLVNNVPNSTPKSVAIGDGAGADGANSSTFYGANVAIGPNAKAGTQSYSFGACVAIGDNARAGASGLLPAYSIALGANATASTASFVSGFNSTGGSYSVVLSAVGSTASYGSVVLGSNANDNSESGVFVVSLSQEVSCQPQTHTYKLLDYDGTIPADRIASTTGLADGNYRLRLVMASGVPTLEWVAE